MNPIEIEYNVRDAGVRRRLLRETVPRALENLPADREPEWGTMTPRQMVLHLVRVFMASRGDIGDVELPVVTPEEKLRGMQAFLATNRPLPRGAQNPLDGSDLPDPGLDSLEHARERLDEEIGAFFDYAAEHPGAVHTNPFFGELTMEQWEKLHYKHCIHHLTQFGLLQAR